MKVGPYEVEYRATNCLVISGFYKFYPTDDEDFWRTCRRLMYHRIPFDDEEEIKTCTFVADHIEEFREAHYILKMRHSL